MVSLMMSQRSVITADTAYPDQLSHWLYLTLLGGVKSPPPRVKWLCNITQTRLPPPQGNHQLLSGQGGRVRLSALINCSWMFVEVWYLSNNLFIWLCSWVTSKQRIQEMSPSERYFRFPWSQHMGRGLRDSCGSFGDSTVCIRITPSHPTPPHPPVLGEAGQWCYHSSSTPS